MHTFHLKRRIGVFRILSTKEAYWRKFDFKQKTIVEQAFSHKFDLKQRIVSHLLLIKRTTFGKFTFAEAVSPSFSSNSAISFNNTAFCTFLTKKLNFKQTHTYARCFAQVSPKTADRYFLNVFDKTNLFTQIQFQAKNHNCAGCFVQVWPKTANRCFLLVFDKTSQFWHISICGRFFAEV